MNINDELFDAIMEEETSYALFSRLQKLFNKFEHRLLGEENAKHYENYRILWNNMNNTGWEKKGSFLIKKIDQAMLDIINEYEDFLP